ncbi:trans-aconitate 2-methyltransferase [Lasius niger]|uniref:Trans-aconitate 2-methyltransferase n=1 Tax=Lasius niger TaxID=67767 RepID=A0A0J7K8N5_LASNI|nr:trans-aconitate 2-methyltransferase [Lasius niger]
MVNPEQYVSLDNMSKRNVSHIINEFAKDLKNISGKCMDVGCGPGDITKNILLPVLNSKATMIGTDIMENVVEYANKTYGDKERLEFEVLDIQTKNLPEKYISKFDHIFSFHALQWCNDIRQMFENIYCILRPAMVTSQYTFAFLDKMPHNLREEFKNELEHMFTEIKVKQYKDRLGNYKLHDEKKGTNIPAEYTVLVAYAQKNVA